MKIGVLSDIHGDYQTFTTVLHKLDTIHQTAHVVCAGDLVGRGPEEDRVVETIRERGIPTVRGNHDEWFYNIKPENSDFLKSLPVDLRITYHDTDIFMCHGKPGSNMWGLYRDHISDTLLNMMLESLGVAVLITGHTHVPLFAQVERGIVVNPGSLYSFKSSRETSHTYGVLDLETMSFELYDAIAEVVEPIGVEGYD
jgi:putative phosphoesterase